jgi:hypothetical protein
MIIYLNDFMVFSLRVARCMDNSIWMGINKLIEKIMEACTNEKLRKNGP